MAMVRFNPARARQLSDAFLLPGALLEGWIAERRSDRSAAEDAYRRALVAAERAGFADHAAFAFAGLGSTALAHGDPRRAEQFLRQALTAAEGARAPWVAAHARVELGRALVAAGDAATAERSPGCARLVGAPRPRLARDLGSSPWRQIRPLRSWAWPTSRTRAATRLRLATCAGAPGSRSPELFGRRSVRAAAAIDVAATWQWDARRLLQ
jgi:hypothetical protein